MALEFFFHFGIDITVSDSFPFTSENEAFGVLERNTKITRTHSYSDIFSLSFKSAVTVLISVPRPPRQKISSFFFHSRFMSSLWSSADLLGIILGAICTWKAA